MERIVDLHPLDGMRSPPHAAVRMHAPVDHVRAIMACARQQAIDAATEQERCPTEGAGTGHTRRQAQCWLNSGNLRRHSMITAIPGNGCHDPPWRGVCKLRR